MAIRLKALTDRAVRCRVRGSEILVAVLILMSMASCNTFANHQLSPREQELANELKTVMRTYLEQNLGETGFGGKVFCAHNVLGINESGEQIHVYVYAVCQEYYLKGEDLTKGTGSALPVALLVQKTGSQYRVVSHEVPGDGSRFSADVERIFPPDIRKKVYSAPSSNASTQAEAEKEAKQYFHK